MKTVQVKASVNYQVRIGENILSTAAEEISAVHSLCCVAIISDSNVWPLYGKTLSSVLEQKGFQVIHYVFPAGEASKNGETYLNILNFLAENQLTRKDLLIALGGGVVGDMTGFVAATYLRGIPYVQIPTTLLSMVDSSVGGKTAIDLPSGKNLAGAFYQPKLVLCDINTLQTLPVNIFRDGCAEVIKYGILYDRSLFDSLTASGPYFDRESVISRCVELKRNVVAEDEFDTGKRQLLNLGHTFGHGVEAHSQYKISHGKAVAIGMAIAAKTACAHKVCSQDTANNIIAILEKFSLPTKTEFTSEQLYTSALSDKKRSGGKINIVLPRQIGNCDLFPIPVSQLEPLIKAGL